MKSVLLFILAVTPSLLICQYIFRMDKYEREPRLHLIICFILGVFCTLPAINMEMLGKRIISADPQNLLRSFLFATFVVSLTEEILKFFALMLYAYPRKEFDEPMDGIVYSVMISMGFAATENILYIQSNPDEAFQIALARAFTAVPAHGLFALIMGYYVGKGKFVSTPNEKLKWILSGISAAILLHGMYDFLLLQEMYQFLMMLATLSIVVGWYFSGRFIKKHQDNSPFRTDKNDELTLSELAASDRIFFVQNEEIIDIMLQRMHKVEEIYDSWGEVHLDTFSGDKWLKFKVASNFTEDYSPRLVRLPGPDINEVIHLTLHTPHNDEILAAAEYLAAKETFELKYFRPRLLARLEEFDFKELSDFHRERFLLLITATNLSTHFVHHKEQEFAPICERATRLLTQLA